MKKFILLFFVFLIFPLFGGGKEGKKRTPGRPRFLEKYAPDPKLSFPGSLSTPQDEYPTTLLLTYDDQQQPPMLCNVNGKNASFTGRFAVPPLLTGIVDCLVLPVREKQPEIIPVAVMVHLTSRQGFVDQEFCKLLRGERSTERQFLDLLAARKRQTGTSLNVANLVLPDDEISPVRIVCESGKDIIDAPNLEELFAKMFEDYDKDSRIGREMKRYRCNTQFQTLKLRRGERNHFKLCINPRWQFGREGDVIEGPIQMWGNNRFYIQEMKEVPKQDIPPTGILWLVTKLSEGWKELTGS